MQPPPRTSTGGGGGGGGSRGPGSSRRLLVAGVNVRVSLGARPRRQNVHSQGYSTLQHDPSGDTAGEMCLRLALSCTELLCLCSSCYCAFQDKYSEIQRVKVSKNKRVGCLKGRVSKTNTMETSAREGEGS
ncbi:hypothetical protein NL108_013273 [Boleophthalmus pectinirostris]|nr:hypothetical protein NL108_013273 [Boleophthalmus pectinirostris]